VLAERCQRVAEEEDSICVHFKNCRFLKQLSAMPAFVNKKKVGVVKINKRCFRRRSNYILYTYFVSFTVLQIHNFSQDAEFHFI
jgi:hypothetical protein